MGNTYIKIFFPKTGVQKTPEKLRPLIPSGDIDTDIPIANPDFKNKMDEVSSWLIEFEADSYFPNREIGLNESGIPIMIMPWRKNYGYWTDNNLVIEDFRKHFETIDISKAEFENNWNLFEKKMNI